MIGGRVPFGLSHHKFSPSGNGWLGSDDPALASSGGAHGKRAAAKPFLLRQPYGESSYSRQLKCGRLFTSPADQPRHATRHIRNPVDPGACAALRGHGPGSLGRTLVPSARTAFRRPRGIRETGVPSRIAPDGGPPCTFASLQRSIAAPPHRPASSRGNRLPDDASSPRLCCPTTHAGSADPFVHEASGLAPCHVRGLVTSLAASTTDPANLLAKARASTGFSLQGVLLASIGPPFGSLGPLGVPRDSRPLAEPKTQSTSGR
jgi:hypothetical protein